MRVVPVDLDICKSCHVQPPIDGLRRRGSSLYDEVNGKTTLYDEIKGESTLYDEIKGESSSKTNPAMNVFTTISTLNERAYAPRDTVIRDPGFVNIWLQYPNDIIRDMAMQIVKPSDSDDVKMEKIQRWVVYNIEYMTDEEQYGYEELWVPPVMVLRTGKGDCEDAAFLIMSLGLNAGVDPSRLRMYGGLVDAGQGAASGSHGWVAYRRESDNEWVAVDFSYYPDLRPMDYRTPLKDDEKYVDDYFYITDQYIVTTENTNRIRNPEVYFSDGSVIPNIFFPTGSLLSWYA
jgi:predicted transglutaminase-like cysteine proteinase